MRNASLSVAILAGGLGTRLRSVVSGKPKVLVEVRGRPFLEYLLDAFAGKTVTEIVLCTGYFGEQIRNKFGGSYKSMDLRYSHEELPLGTAGSLKLALPLFQSDPIVVCNGDSFINFNLESMLSFHVRTGAQATMLVAQSEGVGRYGQVILDKSGQVLSFTEKSRDDCAGWINAGVYLLNRSVITNIPEDTFCSLENEIFPTLVKDDFFGMKVNGVLWDIGTPDSYAVAQDRFIPAAKS